MYKIHNSDDIRGIASEPLLLFSISPIEYLKNL